MSSMSFIESPFTTKAEYEKFLRGEIPLPGAKPPAPASARVAEIKNTEAETSRQLLSRHVVIATFSGLEAGREPMLRIYPPQPAKQWAAFDILQYEEYEKPGKYGDPQQTRFAFVPAEADAAIAATTRSLARGARCRLSWRHEYVTRSSPPSAEVPCGTSSSFPERPVVLLERLDGP